MCDFDLKLRLGLHWRKLFRIRDKSEAFQNRIDFAVYTLVDESEINTLLCNAYEFEYSKMGKSGNFYESEKKISSKVNLL